MTRRSTVLLTAAVLTLGAATLVPAPAVAATTPTVRAVSPKVGVTTGGTKVTVTGTNFARGAVVKFGASTGTAVTVASTSRLTVTAPAHAAGTVDVRVTVSGRTSAVTTADRFVYGARPTVTSVSPNAGTPVGGGTVVVRGTGFTSTSVVRFGAARAASTYVSATQLKAVVPQNPAGAVTVAVTTAYGASAPTAAGRYVYRDRPGPITGLVVADVSAASVALRWDAPSSDIASVVVRRAAGGVAPATAASGTAVATVPRPTTGVLDSPLPGPGAFTYALFARTTEGPLTSDPATITVVVPENSRPDVPGQLTTVPASSGNCLAGYAWMPKAGLDEIRLASTLTDPDGTDTLTGTFRLWDETDGGRVDLTPAGGLSDSTTGNGLVFVRLGNSGIVDGHSYAWTVSVDDGHGGASASSVCRFQADLQSPTATITSSDAGYKVGKPAHFHLSATDPASPQGPGSGVVAFRYSFSSSAEVVSGTRVPAVDGAADLTATPSSWGSRQLFVQALDAAGNVSYTAVFGYYVVDG